MEERTWQARDSDLGRPIAAPLEQCPELLGVGLATIREVAARLLVSEVTISTLLLHRCEKLGVRDRAGAAC